MKRTLKTIAIFALISNLSSCIGLQYASVSDLDSNAGKAARVSATTSGTGFLMWTIPDAKSLEIKAMNELKEKGATKNITSRLSMRNFLIVQLYEIHVEGEK